MKSSYYNPASFFGLFPLISVTFSLSLPFVQLLWAVEGFSAVVAVCFYLDFYVDLTSF